MDEALLLREPLFDVLVSLVRDTSFVEMEPAFQTVSVLGQLFSGTMAVGITSTPELLAPCFHPEAFARARDDSFLLALAGFLSSSPADFGSDVITSFLEMCTAACEIAFGVPRRDHDEGPEQQEEEQDEEQGDESEVMEVLYEAIICGFATLIFIARGDSDFLAAHVAQWTLTAEKLVLRHKPAAAPQNLGRLLHSA
jgi:hypothetical protein